MRCSQGALRSQACSDLLNVARQTDQALPGNAIEPVSIWAIRDGEAAIPSEDAEMATSDLAPEDAPEIPEGVEELVVGQAFEDLLYPEVDESAEAADADDDIEFLGFGPSRKGEAAASQRTSSQGSATRPAPRPRGAAAAGKKAAVSGGAGAGGDGGDDEDPTRRLPAGPQDAVWVKGRRVSMPRL